MARGGFDGWAGLHFMVGAVVDSSWFNQEKMDMLRHHVLFAVMPVFFLTTGLRTNWGVSGSAVFLAAAVLLVASVSGKLVGTSWPEKSFSGARGKRPSLAGCCRLRR